jgi:hypothetical protein
LRDLLVFLGGASLGALTVLGFAWDWFPQHLAVQGDLSGERAARVTCAASAGALRAELGVCRDGQRGLARQVGHLTDVAETWHAAWWREQ